MNSVKIKYIYFDWELYLKNYPDLKSHYNTKDKAWWHYINIGMKKKYNYYEINQHNNNNNNSNHNNNNSKNSNFNNFDWELYLINYPDLKSHYNTKDKAWWHYINIGMKKDYIYFDINKHKRVLKQNLFYYVGTTAYQNFNSGIQRVTRNLSTIIGNYFKEYELFLVIYDNKINDLRTVNKKELGVFCKYNGYNHLENNSNKSELFKTIKEKGANITLFIPELLHTNQNDILNKIIEKSKTYNYKTMHIYHDDSIYNNNELNENFRKEAFDTYINIISNIDIILPNSKYSKSTYLFHKKRLNINTTQIITPISLPGEILNSKRIITKPYVKNYIFANLSITKRKNIDTLIKSFNLLNKEFPQLKLVICGVIYQENEYYQSFKNELTEHILFEENKTDIEICELYQNALFSVYPSIEEGFGLPIYESLWNCTPVICHNATSTLEIANKINSNCVKCIDCLNVNTLYLQMKTWVDTEYLKSTYREIKNIKIKTWYQYTDEIICNLNKNNKKEKVYAINNSKTIYYYVHNTCMTNIRTGIQIFTIYLAKQLIKKNVKIVLVKWDELNNILVPCNNTEIDNLFNYGETEDIMKEINYNSSEAIHLTDKNIKNCIFLNPEYTNPKYSSNLNIYLCKISIKTVHILHDIIPLVLDNFYVREREFFNSYFMNNILTSDKIITISNFTKIEFLNYCKTNNLFNINKFPIVKSILSPYQYRNKTQIINNNTLNCNNTISILLPGTIEPRKQQLLFMQLFNKFIQNNPEINAEIITFGHVYDKPSFDTEIENSHGKIKYLGIIDNNQLFELYKNVSFSCFISYYEGFGFPISESLWHGTPVLTANFGSMYEIAKHGGCYCVDTNNEDEIYEALEVLVKNPNVLLELKKQIENAAFTTWESYADEVYNEIIDM